MCEGYVRVCEGYVRVRDVWGVRGVRVRDVWSVRIVWGVRIV